MAQVPPETILKKSDPAPFMGVLVPEPNYRAYKKAEEYNKYLIEKAGTDELCPPTLSTHSSFADFALGGLVGLGIGAVLFIRR